jgi:hypothetical protein
LWFLCEDSSDVASGISVRSHAGVLLGLQRDVLGRVNRPYLRNYDVALRRPAANLLYSTPPIDPRIAAQRGLFAFSTAPVSSADCRESELGLPVPSPLEKGPRGETREGMRHRQVGEETRTACRGVS